ncbi:fused response regulator/phosphatase [Mucilaginibacter sp. CSA2-8R]|uniref:fused response regulator/phosphatase n=1 Tax=Mucilaginibacter sp. CSA2-8R TaxID=3141542 RepID=UPI00315CC592
MATGISKNILLVDDNPLFLKILCQAFTAAGFNCHAANSGAEALESLKTFRPDVILSDYEMPGMNGLEFRLNVLQTDALKEIPFLFLTAHEDEGIMYTGLNLQAIDYVLKTTPFDVIVAKLNNLLHTVSKQREITEKEIRKTVAALNIKTVPENPPQIKGFKVDFWHQSYQNIPGGDFIDFIDTDNYLFIVIGDLMGKKWKAWFYTFTYLSYIRAAIRFSVITANTSLANTLQQINAVIWQDEGLANILSSVSLVRIEKQTGRVIYSGAGDLPLLHYRADIQNLLHVKSTGMLLGVLPDGLYTEQEIVMAHTDQLFIFTDGLIDINSGGQQKTDYNYFANQMADYLHAGQAFNDIKNNLQQQAVVLTDDSSIICLQKI